MVGDATLLPTRIKMSKTETRAPRSAIDPILDRWAAFKAGIDLVAAVETCAASHAVAIKERNMAKTNRK